jgi:hypothetical protein
MATETPAPSMPPRSPAPGEKLSPTKLIRSTKVWYSDGNLVLQAEDMLFKVHRGILSARSKVFAGMLAVSRPDNSTEEFVDNCPVVQLPGDESYDVRHALRAIYGARRHVLTFS